ncbi:MAG: 50S ribosomal protein L9 [Patescibacteria group bacterium]
MGVKVIILQDIKGIGKKFDVKEIKDGYAKNFLIPRGLAKIATNAAVKELETKKSALKKKEKELKIKLESLVKNLAHREFVFSLNTGKKGEVFGSITKDDIKTRIDADTNADLREYIENNLEIKLEKPIKTIGEHQVEINLGRGVKTTLNIKIEPLSS